jgi:hypothetical protein
MAAGTEDPRLYVLAFELEEPVLIVLLWLLPELLLDFEPDPPDLPPLLLLPPPPPPLPPPPPPLRRRRRGSEMKGTNIAVLEHKTREGGNAE